MATDEVRKDLRAAVAARQELGAEYESELIESFLEKLDARTAHDQLAKPAKPVKESRESDPGGLALALVSVVMGIPITAIAATQEGTIAVVVCWGGLVGINLARSISRIAGRSDDRRR